MFRSASGVRDIPGGGWRYRPSQGLVLPVERYAAKPRPGSHNREPTEPCRGYRRPMSESVHELIASLAGEMTGRRVIDLGAGSNGTLPPLLAGCAPSLTVAVDLNPDSLCARTDASSRVLADLAAPLPVRTSSLDLVLSHNTLECLADPAAFLRECHRILGPAGRLLISHTDFDSISLNAADRELCRRVVRTYCELPVLYRYMKQADSQMGRRLPGLVRKAGFTVQNVSPHVKIETALRGDASTRIDEMAWSVRRAIASAKTDLTDADVERWQEDLRHRDASGGFFFSETAYIVDASPAQ